MSLAGDRYYIQGFCLDCHKTSVQFVQSLFENSITVENKVVITFKPGAKTNDFINLLPNGITIDNNRDLTQMRVTPIKPILIYLNSTIVECYDLENRIINYLVVYDRESAILEDIHHSSMIILHADVSNILKMKSIVNNSKYLKFLSLPLSEYYSYQLVNTHGSNQKVLSETNVPLYLSKYTPYRIEYSKVLLSFYEEVKLQVPGFSIYLGGTKLGSSTSMDSDRITITLEGIGDRGRRPYMNDVDIVQATSILNLKVQTSDQLKYSFIKNAYQNLNALSNLARFKTLDSYDLEWMTHVEWESLKDNIRMSEIRDDKGRFSYTMDIRCSLNYYIVVDKMYSMIRYIDINYVNLANGKGLNLQIT